MLKLCFILLDRASFYEKSFSDFLHKFLDKSERNFLGKVAISACLMGEQCRYDATDNYDVELMTKLEGYELVPFCPEDHAFGSPRPTMDLIQTEQALQNFLISM